MTLIPDLERDLIDAATRVRPLRRRLQTWVVVAGAVGVAALAGLALSTAPGPTGGDGEPGRRAPAERQPSGNDPIDPANVTVAVLNGTGVPGRAAAVGDDLLGARFRLGTISNAPARATKSVVTFTPGHRREARAVAKQLGISQLARMNRETKALLVGPASVAIIIGPDLAQQLPGR